MPPVQGNDSHALHSAPKVRGWLTMLSSACFVYGSKAHVKTASPSEGEEQSQGTPAGHGVLARIPESGLTYRLAFMLDLAILRAVTLRAGR